VSLSYDPSLATGLSGETLPAGEIMPGGLLEPEHRQLSFQGYPLAGTFHEPRIIVYPAPEFEAVNEFAGQIMADLRQVLVDRPSAPEGALPFLPMFNAGQVMHTQVAYLDFQNGSGVRYLTQYAQAYVVINSQDLFYTFQGLTGDGAYYVAALLPVGHPSLPADGSDYPGGFEAFMETYETYILETRQMLDAQGYASFQPDLSLLDGMIGSLEVY
jgi:hypothetical protein